jgi:hypothetical protein
MYKGDERMEQCMLARLNYNARLMIKKLHGKHSTALIMVVFQTSFN